MALHSPMLPLPHQEAMGDPALQDYHKWSPQEVASFFASKGYAEYADLFVQHKLTGERVVLLSSADIEQMGITVIGDRLGIQMELKNLKSLARQAHRACIVGEYQQSYPGNDCEAAIREVLCGMCCPWEPDHYTLTSTALKIRSFHVARCCGRQCACWGGQWATDNIPLDRIVDVDTLTTVKGFACFAVNKTTVAVAAYAGTQADSEEARVVTQEMFTDSRDGEVFANKIRNQIEEYRVQQVEHARQ